MKDMMMQHSLSPVFMLSLILGLAACDVVGPNRGSNSIIARGADNGYLDSGPLVEGEAAIVYDPDGCQGWLIDDGIEGYSGRRFDPVSGLPICNNAYPPGTVLGAYQTKSASTFTDWVPGRGARTKTSAGFP